MVPGTWEENPIRAVEGFMGLRKSQVPGTWDFLVSVPLVDLPFTGGSYLIPTLLGIMLAGAGTALLRRR